MNRPTAIRGAGKRPGYRTSAAGQGLVEMALVLPVFIFIMMILFDFGRVVYAQNAINNDAREGARTAVVNAGFSTAKYNAIRGAAQRMSPLVSFTGANITGRPGVTCPVADPNGGCFYPDPPASGQPVAGQQVELNISISVPIITPVISNLLGGSISLTAKSVDFIQCSGC